MNRLLIATVAFAAFTTASFAMSAADKKDMDISLRQAVSIARAAKLCPQYTFSATEIAPAMIALARSSLGDKDTTAIIDSVNKAIFTLIAMGHKDIMCDNAKNIDAQLEESAK